MSDNTPKTAPSFNTVEQLASPSLSETDPRLSPFAQVAVGADRARGKIPRVHDGMTLEDAVLITGLPRQEAARRVHKMKGSSDPQAFAQNYLSEGAGEQYQAEQTSSPPIGAMPVAEAEPAAMENPPSAEIIQFPLYYGDDTRIVSNNMARCSLFAAVKEREYFKDYVMVGEIDGYLIEWKGEQLNQDDHDTLLQLVMMARNKPYGIDIVQAINEILRALDRHTHKEQRRQLFEQCDRLMSGTIRITPKGKPSYAGHLLLDIVTPQNQETEPQYRRFFSYQLNPKFASFYNSKALTIFDWKGRLKLKGRGSELAKWLHFWIVSHAEQYPHKVETIRQKCGSRIKDLKAFRQNLRAALSLLKDAGIITAWQIDDSDLVHIQRTPSAAQLEHLTKRAAKTPKPPKE